MESRWRRNVIEYGLWTAPKNFGRPEGYVVLAARKVGYPNQFVCKPVWALTDEYCVLTYDPITRLVSLFRIDIPPLHPRFPYGQVVESDRIP